MDVACFNAEHLPPGQILNVYAAFAMEHTRMIVNVLRYIEIVGLCYQFCHIKALQILCLNYK